MNYVTGVQNTWGETGASCGSPTAKETFLRTYPIMFNDHNKGGLIENPQRYQSLRPLRGPAVPSTSRELSFTTAIIVFEYSTY